MQVACRWCIEIVEKTLYSKCHGWILTELTSPFTLSFIHFSNDHEIMVMNKIRRIALIKDRDGCSHHSLLVASHRSKGGLWSRCSWGTSVANPKTSWIYMVRSMAIHGPGIPHAPSTQERLNTFKKSWFSGGWHRPIRTIDWGCFISTWKKINLTCCWNIIVSSYII